MNKMLQSSLHYQTNHI